MKNFGGQNFLGPYHAVEYWPINVQIALQPKLALLLVLWLESVAFVFALVRKRFRHVCFGAKALYS